jgi:hypothetical protein
VEETMRRWNWLVVCLALVVLVACGSGGGTVPFYELLSDPGRFDRQEVTVLAFYYQGSDEQILVVGVRTDDGFQNPVPLGEALWVEGMPQSILEQLNFASGITYGMVEVSGLFETAGAFGPDGKYVSRVTVSNPSQVVALEASQMEQTWVREDPAVPGAVPLAELVARADSYSDQTVTVVAYYYWTPQTWVLAEGIRSLDGVHNAVPIGKQVWVEGFPPDVTGALNVLENNVHGLVRVSGRFETRGGYGANQAYPYRLIVQSAEALER